MQVRGEMARSLTSKLESQRGASMPLALLLFLICASLAAVVLAAATTAAGQASQRAQADQAYYSVTSAAELFSDELDGQTVTIIQTKTGNNYTLRIGSKGDYPKDTLSREAAGSPGGNATLLELAALDKLCGEGTSNFAGSLSLAGVAGQAWNGGFSGGSSITGQSLSFSHSLGGAEGFNAAALKAAVDVTVSQEIKPDGSVVLVFSGGSGNGAVCQAKLTLSSDVQVFTAEDRADGSSLGTTTRTTEITWHTTGVGLLEGGA